MSTTAEHGQQHLYGIHELAARWGVSRDLVRRLIDAEQLHSVTIAARRMIPITEITRAELLGVGRARKRKVKEATQIAD